MRFVIVTIRIESELFVPKCYSGRNRRKRYDEDPISNATIMIHGHYGGRGFFGLHVAGTMRFCKDDNCSLLKKKKKTDAKTLLLVIPREVKTIVHSGKHTHIRIYLDLFITQ